MVKIRVFVWWIVVHLFWHLGASIFEDNTTKRNRLAIFHFSPLSCIIRNSYKPIALLANGFHNGFLLGLFWTLMMEVTCFFEISANFNGLHGVISQKIELFIQIFFEYGVSMFLRNIVTHLPDYTVSQPWRLQCVYEISARPPEYVGLS